MNESDGEDDHMTEEERRNIQTGRWTKTEHTTFMEGLELHGKEWKKIADMIKTRSVVQIRTHAQKYFQKVAKSTGGPVMSTSKKEDVVKPPSSKKRKNSIDDDTFEEIEPRKPNSIKVPSFHDSNGSSNTTEHKDDKADGGLTPRTLAAATILLRPRIQHKLQQSGGDTPTTRQQASWLDTHQERAAQALRRRPTNGFTEPLSWDKAKNDA